jgi:hypothetical protein
VERVENGTRGTVMSVDDRTDRVRLRTEEPDPRVVAFSTREFNDVRLAYAQHVYKAQGLTTDRAMALMGGWQSDRERAYVALSRARERTDVYVARDDLGHEGVDADLVNRLADRVAVTHAQQASVTRDEVRRDQDVARWQSGGREDGSPRRLSEPHRADARGGAEPEVESRVGRVLREQRERERARGRDHGIE